ncbi:MAG: hypothetical protein CVU60_09205 [Deltaproteobacteria bacterium HGW-Deltaproteobacteria-18]|nr:MAG: hypothetical protein CVU60_09205 [Deltaproteobacteria bacterium HGW-Deltaproteobacteria-18]
MTARDQESPDCSACRIRHAEQSGFHILRLLRISYLFESDMKIRIGKMGKGLERSASVNFNDENKDRYSK